MSKVVLGAINARYSHASFGIRYLAAQLAPEVRAQVQVLEWTLQQKPGEIAESILAENPEVVGLGVYIWNTDRVREVVSLLRQLRPELLVVLGGPEISYETEKQPLFALCNTVIAGEADLLFRDWLQVALAGGALALKDHYGPAPRKLAAPTPDLEFVNLPYGEFSNHDLKNRVLYVEASRGCPYKCEYCLSSLDKGVRAFPLESFLSEMKVLLDRGARQFKFVDRTFNLSPTTSTSILRFFFEEMTARGELLFLHFELVPDRLPDVLKEWIEKFPAGCLQFEIGIQTWNPKVAHRISRRQDYGRISENLQYLHEKTKVHSHADLIVGLPGEDLKSFQAGFDALWALKPDEIQVGILKRLKGTPISRHDSEWGMKYQDFSPFTVIETSVLSFAEVQAMERFSKNWDHFANSGNFKKTLGLWSARCSEVGRSFFGEFFEFSEVLFQERGQTHSIALLSLLEVYWNWIQSERTEWKSDIQALLIQDYAEGPLKRDVPRFLTANLSPQNREAKRGPDSHLPLRQRKHLES